jgi:hypothetical protein
VPVICGRCQRQPSACRRCDSPRVISGRRQPLVADLTCCGQQSCCPGNLDGECRDVVFDIERGSSAISDLLDWTLYTILPTLLEVILVTAVLVWAYDWGFALITLAFAEVFRILANSVPFTRGGLTMLVRP